MTEPMTKAKDLAYVRVEAPDLEVGEKFLTDFGMSISARTADAARDIERATYVKPSVHYRRDGSPLDCTDE